MGVALGVIWGYVWFKLYELLRNILLRPSPSLSGPVRHGPPCSGGQILCGFRKSYLKMLKYSMRETVLIVIDWRFSIDVIL